MAITPEQAIQKLTRMGDPKALRKVLTNALRRGGRRIEKGGEDRFVTRGIGRRLYGKKKAGARKLITLGRPRDRGDSVEVDLTATGLAAIQETGGQLAPHVIRPKTAPRLAFKVAGDLVFSKVVHHPGATHPRIPSVEPALERGVPEGTAEIRAAVDAHIDKALR